MRIVRAFERALRSLLYVFVLALALFWGWAQWRERLSVDYLAPRDGLRLATDEGHIFAQASGPVDAQPLLIVHGTAAWSGFWRPAIDEIGRNGYRAVALDLPPFGFSTRDPDHRYSRADQAKRIAAAARALGPRKPILIGHSFGAGPALEAILRHPEAFSGLVIVCGALALGEGETPPPTPLPAAAWLAGQPVLTQPLIAATATNPLLTRFLLAQMLHRSEAATDAIAAELQRPQWLPGTTAAYAAWLPNLLFPDAAALSMRPANLRTMTMPTAIIWGRQDAVTPLAQGERIASLIPGASIDVLDGVGHIPHIEAPDAFLAALLPRLRSLAGQP